MWLQSNDDKKLHKIKKRSLYDKIKLPLFVSLIILIIKDFDFDFNFTKLSKISNLKPDINNLKPDINNLKPNITNLKPEISNTKPNFYGGSSFESDMNDIFIGPPDF